MYLNYQNFMKIFYYCFRRIMPLRFSTEAETFIQNLKICPQHFEKSRTSANTTAVLIRVEVCPKVQFLGQILDYNSHIWLKFEFNGINKPLLLIKTVPFYLRQYHIPLTPLSHYIRKILRKENIAFKANILKGFPNCNFFQILQHCVKARAYNAFLLRASLTYDSHGKDHQLDTTYKLYFLYQLT